MSAVRRYLTFSLLDQLCGTGMTRSDGYHVVLAADHDETVTKLRRELEEARDYGMGRDIELAFAGRQRQELWKDAERYRWLRNQKTNTGKRIEVRQYVFGNRLDFGNPRRGAGLDSVIDAALLKE